LSTAGRLPSSGSQGGVDLVEVLGTVGGAHGVQRTGGVVGYMRSGSRDATRPSVSSARRNAILAASRGATAWISGREASLIQSTSSGSVSDDENARRARASPRERERPRPRRRCGPAPAPPSSIRSPACAARRLPSRRSRPGGAHARGCSAPRRNDPRTCLLEAALARPGELVEERVTGCRVLAEEPHLLGLAVFDVKDVHASPYVGFPVRALGAQAGEPHHMPVVADDIVQLEASKFRRSPGRVGRTTR
jgi:hypothetical protein